MPEDEARIEGLYNVIGSDLDDEYIANVKSLSIHPEIIAEQAKDMTIVYTPLHGTGNIPVRRVLRELGFTHVIVEPQPEPGGPEGVEAGACARGGEEGGPCARD